MGKAVMGLMVIAACLACSSDASALALFGYTFDDNAFSDDAEPVKGALTYWGFSKWGYTVTGNNTIDLRTALNGPDLYTGIEGDTSLPSSYVVDVLFTNNFLFNGPSTDLIIFERGSAEGFGIAVFDSRINDFTSINTYMPSWVGDLPNSVESSPGVNVAEVNFSTWGIPADQPVNRVRLYEDRNYGSADIAALGGLNSKSVITESVVPESSSLILLGIGVLGIALLKRGRSRRA